MTYDLYFLATLFQITTLTHSSLQMPHIDCSPPTLYTRPLTCFHCIYNPQLFLHSPNKTLTTAIDLLLADQGFIYIETQYTYICQLLLPFSTFLIPFLSTLPIDSVIITIPQYCPFSSKICFHFILLITSQVLGITAPFQTIQPY